MPKVFAERLSSVARRNKLHAAMDYVRDGDTRTVLETRPMVFVSRISYSLYLWHLTMLKFVEHAFGTITPITALA
ncbi:MAG: hypothetical protein JO122_03100, partial [Acetobacteraceae bacterium]|nr:hypothetical protein [Acetobacteraceae bacterium]